VVRTRSSRADFSSRTDRVSSGEMTSITSPAKRAIHPGPMPLRVTWRKDKRRPAIELCPQVRAAEIRALSSKPGRVPALRRIRERDEYASCRSRCALRWPASKGESPRGRVTGTAAAGMRQELVCCHVRRLSKLILKRTLGGSNGARSHAATWPAPGRKAITILFHVEAVHPRRRIERKGENYFPSPQTDANGKNESRRDQPAGQIAVFSKMRRGLHWPKLSVYNNLRLRQEMPASLPEEQSTYLTPVLSIWFVAIRTRDKRCGRED